MESAQPLGFINLILLVVMSLPFAVIANLLAKQKGRGVALWTILGLLPVINIFCMWYFVGASNLRLEKKIDELLSKKSGSHAA